MWLTSKNKLVGGVSAAVLALAIPFLGTWEGQRNYAYIPIPGDVPTICYGHTADVKMGDYKTYAECEILLRIDAAMYYTALSGCMVNKDIPVSVQASLLELSINVGTSSVCKSTALKHANNGLYHSACAELDKWVKAGGKTIKGLVNRRNASQEMCLKDVK